VLEAARFWENVIAYSSFEDSHRMTIQVGGTNQEWTADKKVLASAGPENGRLDANGRWMPTSGTANINNNPLAIEGLTSSIDSFRRVMIHELGHVMGIGTLWQSNGRSLINSMTGMYHANTYAGFAYGELLRSLVPSAIPLTINQKDDDSNYSHWREEIFNTELMTHEAEFDGVMRLSQMTIASLRDIGWMVNYGAADFYALPVG
jgi:Leishmanolysin